MCDFLFTDLDFILAENVVNNNLLIDLLSITPQRFSRQINLPSYDDKLITRPLASKDRRWERRRDAHASMNIQYLFEACQTSVELVGNLCPAQNYKTDDNKTPSH